MRPIKARATPSPPPPPRKPRCRNFPPLGSRRVPKMAKMRSQSPPMSQTRDGPSLGLSPEPRHLHPPWTEKGEKRKPRMHARGAYFRAGRIFGGKKLARGKKACMYLLCALHGGGERRATKILWRCDGRVIAHVVPSCGPSCDARSGSATRSPGVLGLSDGEGSDEEWVAINRDKLDYGPRYLAMLESSPQSASVVALSTRP